MLRRQPGSMDLRGHFQSNKPQKEEEELLTPEDAPLDLTFGIEIECLLLRNTWPEDARTQASEQPSLGRETIHSVLSQPPQVQCTFCKVQHTFHMLLNDIRRAGHQQEAMDPEYTKWTIDEDSSLDLTSREYDAFESKLQFLHFDQIEIKSRVIHADHPLPTTRSTTDPLHIHTVSWEDEVEAVYNRLVEAFNTPPGASGFRLAVNPSCGLHVHLGNGKKAFPLKTVKNGLSIYVANERAIDSIHSVDRLSGSTLAFSEESNNYLCEHYMEERLDSTYNIPWSLHFQWVAFKISRGPAANADGTAPDHGYRWWEYPANAFPKYPSLEDTCQCNDVPSWLKVIRCAKDIRDLRQLQGVLAYNSTVNLLNLTDFSADGSNRSPFNSKKMTIKFRQHGATLRPAKAIAWINVLLKLITFCHGHSLSDVKKLCGKLWRDPSHTALDFLKVIDVPSKTIKHYKAVLARPSEQSFSLTYAAAFHTKEHEAIGRFGYDDFFSPLTQQIVEEQASNLSGRGIDAKITEKLVNGCYGQFDAEYVDELDLCPKDKKKLMIGWRPDRSGRK